MFKYMKYTKVETADTVLEFRGGDEDVKVNHFDVDAVSIEADDGDAIDALVAKQPNEINCTEIEQYEFKTLVGNSSQLNRITQRSSELMNDAMKEITDKYPSLERDTWNIQVSQAKVYKASSDDNDAPFLKVLADEEGVTVDDFATAVLAKADAYEAFTAQKLAEKRAFQKELMSGIGL